MGGRKAPRNRADACLTMWAQVRRVRLLLVAGTSIATYADSAKMYERTPYLMALPWLNVVKMLNARSVDGSAGVLTRLSDLGEGNMR